MMPIMPDVHTSGMIGVMLLKIIENERLKRKETNLIIFLDYHA